MQPLDVLEKNPEKFFSFIQNKVFNNGNQLQESTDMQAKRDAWAKKRFFNRRGIHE